MLLGNHHNGTVLLNLVFCIVPLNFGFGTVPLNLFFFAGMDVTILLWELLGRGKGLEPSLSSGKPVLKETILGANRFFNKQFYWKTGF